MALDFPSAPTDGQIYDRYVWNNTLGVWSLLSDTTVFGLASNTPTGSYTDGADYEYVSFLTDGTLTVTRGGFFDFLLVGGGGSGGKSCGGGGGAGGMLYLTNAFLPAGSLDVVVGAGGIAPPNDFVNEGYIGENGFPSELGPYMVLGGGGGGNRTFSTTGRADGVKGATGGSGGGGGGSNQTVGLGGFGVTGIGNNGGNSGMNDSGGGGGGAGAVGETAAGSNVAGDGGDGLANSITGSSVTYAGGGGGQANTPGTRRCRWWWRRRNRLIWARRCRNGWVGRWRRRGQRCYSWRWWFRYRNRKMAGIIQCSGTS